MTSTRTAQSTRHHSTLRKDDTMFHIELRLAEIEERHERFRAIREHERIGFRSARSLRQRFGESLVRLGQRVGGESVHAPAWQG
jgi:hypothetical protein